MSIIILGIVSLLIFYFFAEMNFFISMSIMAGTLVVLELLSMKRHGTTVSGRFWTWKKTAPRWRVYLVAGTLAVIGIYLAAHLIWEI